MTVPGSFSGRESSSLRNPCKLGWAIVSLWQLKRQERKSRERRLSEWDTLGRGTPKGVQWPPILSVLEELTWAIDPNRGRIGVSVCLVGHCLHSGSVKPFREMLSSRSLLRGNDLASMKWPLLLQGAGVYLHLLRGLSWEAWHCVRVVSASCHRDVYWAVLSLQESTITSGEWHRWRKS